jgi:hypothetical protein
MKGKTTELAVFRILPDVKVLKNNGMPPHELKIAEGIIEENKEVILEAWNHFFNKNDYGNNS